MLQYIEKLYESIKAMNTILQLVEASTSETGSKSRRDLCAKDKAAHNVKLQVDGQEFCFLASALPSLSLAIC